MPPTMSLDAFDGGEGVGAPLLGTKRPASVSMSLRAHPKPSALALAPSDYFTSSSDDDHSLVDNASPRRSTASQSNFVHSDIPREAENNENMCTGSKRARSGTRENVRRGKWTQEEQIYAERLIRNFEAGLLPLENGATLRAYLSKKLNCDPMRISKKFAGAKCLGKV